MDTINAVSAFKPTGSLLPVLYSDINKPVIAKDKRRKRENARFKISWETVVLVAAVSAQTAAEAAAIPTQPICLTAFWLRNSFHWILLKPACTSS